MDRSTTISQAVTENIMVDAAAHCPDDMLGFLAKLNDREGVMQINGIEVEDTFAEAFDMTGTRIIITVAEPLWAKRAAEAMTGFATSVIGCRVEAGIDRLLDSDESLGGRPGVAILLFSVSGAELGRQLVRRVGQCVLTCPSTAVFAGQYSEKRVAMDSHLRYFGDGHPISKKIRNERYWQLPVLDGEFVCQDTV